MDSCNCNSQDKSTDVKFSTETFTTHLKTERLTEDLIEKTETVEDNVNIFIKQETFVDESFDIKQESEQEEILDENRISQDDAVGTSHYNNFKHESEVMMNLHDSFDVSETDDDYKNKNLQCLNINPSGRKYRETINYEANIGTSAISGNDVQGKFLNITLSTCYFYCVYTL